MFPVSDKQLQSSDDVAAFDKIWHAACIVLPRSFEDQPERLKAFEEAAADLDGGASNSVFRTVVRIKDALVSNAIEPTLFKSFSIVWTERYWEHPLNNDAVSFSVCVQLECKTSASLHGRPEFHIGTSHLSACVAGKWWQLKSLDFWLVDQIQAISKMAILWRPKWHQLDTSQQNLGKHCFRCSGYAERVRLWSCDNSWTYLRVPAALWAAWFVIHCDLLCSCWTQGRKAHDFTIPHVYR